MQTKTITIPFLAKKSIYWGVGGLFAILTAFLLVTRTDQALTIISAAILALITAKNLKFGLYIIIFLPVVGELLRLNAGPAGDLPLSDFFIPIFLGIWLIKQFFISFAREKTSQIPSLTLPFILFIVAAAVSLLHSLFFLNLQEVFSGSLYLVRYLMYGLLYFAAFQIIKSQKDFSRTLLIISAAALFLAIAGFIQLVIYPDLAQLEEFGWDPHINRLVSTWLDPNFVGGFLAFIISILLGITLHIKKNSHKAILLTTIAILTTALFLTFSRSAYLALIAGIFIISLLKSRKILIIALILGLIGLASSERARERTAELAQSVTAIFTETTDTPDPTAQLRIKSYEQTLYLIQKRPFVGSGYNNLRAVNHQEGFVSGEEIHSASGSDSSLLTILATTGILGFIPFILLYILSLKSAFKNWKQKKLPALYRGFSLGLIGAIPSLLIHATFVNSLLFPQILIFFWISLGLLERINYFKV